MAFNNEIERVKAQIFVLQKKLSFLEELEKTKSPVEEAYKKVYGNYPVKEVSENLTAEDNWNVISWSAFQDGYKSAQKDYKVGEFQETAQERGERLHKDVERVVKENMKWFEEHPDQDPLNWLKPQTPEQVADGLKEAFVKAQQTENWKELQKKIDAPAEGIYDNIDVNKLLEKWEKDPPEFLKFELGQSLTDLIYDWWEDIFTVQFNDDMETSIDDLVSRISNWLPKHQSAAGSQSLGVEDMVEGFNDCLNKIKRKLR